MKVLHILHELKFSGAEIMYTAAAPEFRKLGCKLYVVNTSVSVGEYAPYFEKEEYTVLHWAYYKKSLPEKIRYIKSVVQYLKDEKIDVVHIHRTDMKWIMSLCAKIAGCKAVYTFHSVFKSHWYSYVYHFMIRWSAKNILGCKFQTISDSVYKNEKEYYHNNTIKIYNWYDNTRFFPSEADERLRLREKLYINEHTLVIVSIGGCSHIKRHSHIIEAVKIIAAQYPDVIYLHLGEGQTLQEEIDLAKELNVYKNVKFLHNQRDVRSYLIASDVYVMASKIEGISLTTIESLACKIPTVLYDVPGLRDFNKQVECTVLIKEDYKLLAQAIIDLYRDKPKQYRLAKNGKSFVDANFFMPDNAKKIFALYK